MMERPSRTLKVQPVKSNAYSSEHCAQAKNKKDEKKYDDIDDGDNRIFLLRGKVVQIPFIQELWIR